MSANSGLGTPATSLYDLCEHCGHLYKVHFNSECGHVFKIDINKPIGMGGENSLKCSCPGFSKKQEMIVFAPDPHIGKTSYPTNPCAEIDLTTVLPVEIDVPEMPIPEPLEGVQGVVDPETGVTTYLLPDGAVTPIMPPTYSWDQDMARMCQCGHTKGKHTQIIVHLDGKATGGVCCGSPGHTKYDSDCPSKCQMFTEVLTTTIPMKTVPQDKWAWQNQYMNQAVGAAGMAALDYPIVMKTKDGYGKSYKNLILDDLVSSANSSDNPNIKEITKEQAKLIKSANFGLPYGMSGPMILDYETAFSVYKKKEKIKAHTEAQLQDVGNWLWQAGAIKKTVIQGHDLRDICIAYAAKAMEEMTANFDANVEKAVQKRMDFEKKQHKAKCIPSYKKNGRKFRDDNG